MKILISATLLTAILPLAACGGGGGSMNSTVATQSPPVINEGLAPTAIDPASLISFANENPDSTSTTRGVVRQTRAFEEGGQAGVVMLDRLEGSDAGLVQYRLGNDVFVYSTTGEPVSTDVIEGTYGGGMDLNYIFDANSAPGVMSGDSIYTLRPSTGEVYIGGMAFNDKHSIELFGNGDLVGNKFTVDNVSAVLRDQTTGGGAFVRRETVTVSGFTTTNETGSAVFGTVQGSNATTRFSVNGGFSAGLLN